MSTAVLNPDAQKFPAGTTVKAFARSNFPSVWDRTGAPQGTQTASATVATDGSVTFTGLADSTEYLLYAASPDRYATFLTPAAAVSAGSAPDADESTKGLVQLAGDLGGTAAAPTVPGLTAKADLASPALTGTPTVPTQAQGNNSTRIASTAYVQTEVGLLVPKSLVDAKGDLLVGTANDTVARMGVGSNGQVLVADSAQTPGIKWAVVPSKGAASSAWAPTGAIENMSRATSRIADAVVIVSGQLALFGGGYIPAGTPINNISFVSNATPAGTPLNQWFCLVDQSLNVLAKTVDDTTTAWAANTKKTLALSATYTPGSDIAVYIGIVVVATTPPNLNGINENTTVSGITPRIAGNSTTGLTNPASLGATAAAMSAQSNIAYAYAA